MKTLWKFINSKIFGYLLVVIIAIFLFGAFSKNISLKKEAKRTEQNIIAMNDTLTLEKKKNGDLYASISGYQSDIKDLGNYNQDLADEAKKQGGKIITLTKLVFGLKQDTSDLRNALKDSEFDKPVQENDSTYSIKWKLTYQYDSINFDKFSGKTVLGFDTLKPLDLSHKYTEILERETQISLVYGQKYEKDGVRVFVESPYPGFTPRSLNGVYVDYPKKRHWFTGFGVGPTLNMGYDFMNQKPALIFGVGIHYNIFEW